MKYYLRFLVSVGSEHHRLEPFWVWFENKCLLHCYIHVKSNNGNGLMSIGRKVFQIFAWHYATMVRQLHRMKVIHLNRPGSCCQVYISGSRRQQAMIFKVLSLQVDSVGPFFLLTKVGQKTFYKVHLLALLAHGATKLTFYLMVYLL